MVRKNHTGAAHFALCLHFGIGIPEDLEMACDSYGFAVSGSPRLAEPTFRCLRGLNKAKLTKHRLRYSVVEAGTSRPRSLPLSPAAARLERYRRPEIGRNGQVQIGHGGYGTVTAGTDRKTGPKVAVKHLTAAGNAHGLRQEVENLSRLNHSCVIRILGWWDSPNSTHGEIHMEFAENGDLNALLEGGRGSGRAILGQPTEKAKLIARIVLGMRYVHSM
jgi:hypothetical protein